MTTSALTDELLSRAEWIYRMTRAEGEARLSGYDGGSGSSAGLRQEESAEEKKKWLT